MSNPWRQLDERHVASKVDLMVWSEKMDLLAISNIKGEVALHRLSWQRVWVLQPISEGAVVTAMAWKPDGKVIAIGYTGGELVLTDVEKKDMICTTKMDSEITCMYWMEEVTYETGAACWDHHDEPVLEKKHKMFSPYTNFLPKLPSLSRSYGSENDDTFEENRKSQEERSLNVLLVGTSTGKVHLSLFGMLSCGVIDVTKHITDHYCCIRAITLSEDLKTLFLAVAATSKKVDYSVRKEKLVVVSVETDILGTHSEELCAMAIKHRHIMKLVTYISHTMRSISEAWENILIEMDSKLMSYASKVPEGSVSADFLELLMFGTPSSELEHFLLQDLTEKGLKKLGHSIEMSYSNIQKLVLKQLQAVMHELTYVISEMLGMAHYASRYEIVGLKIDAVQSALSAAGAFVVKATEVQQVIDTSMKNYKAFFRWLYVAILRLTEERVVSEFAKMNQQELAFIADFLYGFDGATTPSVQTNMESPDVSNRPRFNLEKLGQYLFDRDLTIPQEDSEISWSKFLEENPNLSNHSSIIPHYKYKSLAQLHKYLIVTTNNIFRQPERSISHFLKVSSFTFCSGVEFNSAKPIISISDKDNKLLVACLETGSPAHGIYYLEVPTMSPPDHAKCSYFYFSPKDKAISKEGSAGNSGPLKVLDVQFYLSDTLSVLIDRNHDTRSALFVQFPLSAAKGSIIHTKPIPEELFDTQRLPLNRAPRIEATALLEPGAVRTIENMVAFKLAVSGSRKVAVVLSESRHKVRLFEMEAEEEEDDDDECMDTTVEDSSDVALDE